MLARLKISIEWVLQRLCPSWHYWAVSLYHPARSWFFLRKYPKVVSGRPHIVLVTGEDGPDKMGVYSPVYAVYRVLRPHYNVDLRAHVSFNEKHAAKIAEMEPDLVLLSFDSGEFQQLFEQLRVPLMGSDANTCRTCYDKAAAKERVREHGIATAPWVVVREGEAAGERVEELGLPLVVKPCRSGTSEGLSKVGAPRKLGKAIKRAMKWDKEVIVEPYITGREYTCTVYGNDTPRTLPLNRKIMPFEKAEMEARGEKVPKNRYPVLSDEPFVQEMLDLSKRLYVLFNCRDMVRVDWKYDDATGVPYFIEINTLPYLGRDGGNIAECARAAGSSYEAFILDLFRDALARNREQDQKGEKDFG